MPTDIITLRDPSRADLVQAIADAMVYSRGMKRYDGWTGINAQIAADKLIDGLASANYRIMQGQPSKGQVETNGDRAWSNCPI